MSLEPAETQKREILVKIFKKHNVEKIKVNSISNAIEKIKENQSPKTVSTKISLDGEIVYFSDRHGDIENWESEWVRQKRVMSLDKSTRDCSYGVEYCYENDLCMQCQIDKAAGKL